MPKNERISFIIPVFNEFEGITVFHNSLLKVIKENNYTYEIIYCDDGSSDGSTKKLHDLAKNDKNTRIIELARNFGKELATTAGINNSTGDAVLILDADGQHPVELIPKFVEKWQKGADIVIGIRTTNKKEGFVKKFGSKLFYYLLRKLGVKDVTPGSTDFRIIDRMVADEFSALTEHNRVTRALIDWLGYTKEYIHFSANAREFGEASYSVKKLFQLAFNGFVSLSFTPLYFAGYLGIFIMLGSLMGTLFLIIESIIGDPLKLSISGTAYLALLIIFLVGVLLSCQGLLSIYIARIYSETQNRPLYVVKKSRK